MLKFLFVIAIGAGAYGQLFIQDLGDPYVDYEEGRNCTKTGPLCEDCRTRVFCVPLPDGGWIKEPLDTCPPTQTCQSSTNTCTSDLNVECIFDYKFTCYQTGLFPDAYNCTRYHMCIPTEEGTVQPEPITRDCRSGFFYDPITTLCSKRSCGNNSTVCQEVGQTGKIGWHPRLYYTCLSSVVNGTRVLFPQIFYCQDDSLYVDGECVKPRDLSGLGDDDLCEGSGDFYLEDGCDKYNQCSTGSRPVINSCPLGQRFDPATGGCEDFTCLD